MIYYPSQFYGDWTPRVASPIRPTQYESATSYSRLRFGERRSDGTWYDRDKKETVDIVQKCERMLAGNGVVDPASAKDLYEFDWRQSLRLLVPKLGWPFDLTHGARVGNHFCHTTYGPYKIFNQEMRQTYNAGFDKAHRSPQGYTHIAIDVLGLPFHFFRDGYNLVVNPFPSGAVVKTKGTFLDPDRMHPDEHAKTGNTVKFTFYLDNNPNYFAPWNVFTVTICHLKEGSWRLGRQAALINEFGLPVAEVGFSGYASIRNLHGHTAFNMGNVHPVDPFAGPDNDTILEPVFVDQDKLFQIIDYKRSRASISIDGQSRAAYPPNYQSSKGYVHDLTMRVDHGDECLFAEIHPGEHTYTFISTKPLTGILFDRNPWGPWRPIQPNWRPSSWWQWLKAKYKEIVLDRPTSRNVLDYSITGVKTWQQEDMLGYWDRTGSGRLFRSVQEAQQWATNTGASLGELECLKVTRYYYKVTIPSRGPSDNTKWGLHTYYGIDESSVRTNRIGLFIWPTTAL